MRLILNPRQVVTQEVRKVKAHGSEGEGCGSKGEPEDGDSQQGDSGGEVVEVSCSEAESLGVKAVVAPLSQRWRQKRPI